MGVKRPADEADTLWSGLSRQSFKRARRVPTTRDTSNSSEPSTCSVSEDSALQSSPRASEHTRQSSISSAQPSTYDDESTSNTSTSSDDSSNFDSDEEIVTLGGPKKPEMSHAQIAGGTQDLSARIASFLPRLARANDLLISSGDVQNMEHVDEDEQHIVMDLGLGVLEEKNDESSSESSGDDKDQSESEQENPASSGTVKHMNKGGEVDVMGKLLGFRVRRQKVDIQDLG